MHRKREKRGSFAPLSGMSKHNPVFAVSDEVCVRVCVRWKGVVFDLF